MKSLSAWSVFLFVISSTLFSSTVKADERILSFESEIEVYVDGSMQVTEIVKVQTERKRILRGIYRDFPTSYKDRFGNNYQVQFEILTVLRDGYSESYHTETKSNKIRIYLGRKSHVLSSGVYTYTLVYRTNRQLGYFENHDELYWNVTGNEWIFPIDNVSAVIRLPELISSDSLKLEGYTGLSGEQGNDFTSMINNHGFAQFNSTRTLNAHEGLTIVTTWPKGFIKEPDFKQNVRYLLKDNFSLLLGLVGLLIVASYYYLVWVKVGKDPEAGVIFPHYSPPTGFSPASMRYISRMGYDHKAFATAIVNLAVKGALSISESSKKYRLSKNSINNIELAAGEKVLMEQLFSKSSTISLENTNHHLIAKSISAHKKSLKMDYQRIYFKMNSVWLLPGVLISLGILISIFLTIKSTAGPEKLFLLFWLTGWTLGVVVLLKGIFQLWKKALSGKGSLGAIGLTLFAVPFFAAEIFVIWKFQFSIPLVFTVAAVISTNMLFFNLLKSPTLAGRKLLDKIDGFKMYLEVAEKDELNLNNPPEKTPEIFESYLPAAMALDVELQWADKFTAVFANLQQNNNNYQPSWYHGSHWNNHNLSHFTTSVGSSLSSAIASSSVAPGSSSGSGGGGSSGGGGGGGGGGGW